MTSRGTMVRQKIDAEKAKAKTGLVVLSGASKTPTSSRTAHRRRSSWGFFASTGSMWSAGGGSDAGESNGQDSKDASPGVRIDKVAAGLVHIGVPLEEEEEKALLQDMDANGDGFISLSEFTNAVARQRGFEDDFRQESNDLQAVIEAAGMWRVR